MGAAPNGIYKRFPSLRCCSPSIMTRILIASDFDAMRRGARHVIEEHDGWSVVAEAADGIAAVREAIATKPDVAVLHYALPGINGIEATRQIKRTLPSVEVLILMLYDSKSLM